MLKSIELGREAGLNSQKKKIESAQILFIKIAGKYTMKRFAALYGMKYGGIATNADEASKLFKA